jgi:hypothetical protein
MVERGFSHSGILTRKEGKRKRSLGEEISHGGTKVTKVTEGRINRGANQKNGC